MEMEKQIEQDYGFAMLTMLWAACEDKNHLLFGALDFFPTEITECSEIEKCSMPLEQKDTLFNIQLNFCRVKLSCADALQLYASCRKTGKFHLPCFDSKKISMHEDDADTPPLQLNQWPNVTVDKRTGENICPFLSESWGCCRMHQLLPNTISPQILLIAEYEKPIKWMKERLLWDISMYPELLGSMHLILPNPLIRSVTERLIPDSPNIVAVCLELRQGKSLTDLKDVKFLALERGVFGIRNVKEIQLSSLSNPNFEMTLSGNDTEDFAAAIYDADRGLLEWSDFGNFIMGFDIDMRVANAKRKILLPDNESFYEVTSYESAGKIKLAENEETWGKRLRLQHLERTQGKYAKKFGQHLFKHGNPEAAEVFIRELIQQAKERVIIIDPYFATLELFKYVLGIPSPVNIEIITGNELMAHNSQYLGNEENAVSIGREILHQIQSFQKEVHGYTIQVNVMTGKNVIHDRFLIIDGQVWFSGNSLNNIGSKASMLIRLPNPHELLDYLHELQSDKSEGSKRIIALEEWIQKKGKLENEKEQKFS